MTMAEYELESDESKVENLKVGDLVYAPWEEEERDNEEERDDDEESDGDDDDGES